MTNANKLGFGISSHSHQSRVCSCFNANQKKKKKQSMSDPHVSPFSVYLTIYGLRISIQKLEGGCKVWIGSCFFYNSLNPTTLPFNLPFSSSSPLLSSSYFHNSNSTNFGVKPMADGMENMNYFVLE